MILLSPESIDEERVRSSTMHFRIIRGIKMTSTTTDKYIKQYLAQSAKSQKELNRFVKKLPAIDGFIGEWKDDHNWFAGENRVTKNYVLVNIKAEIKFTFMPGGDGSTSFKAGDHWATFDRRGVESSFYWKPLWEKDERPDIKVILNEQLERIAKHRVYAATAIKVPQISFTVSPENLAKLKVTFKNKGYHRFHPSGFGTGYTVSAKPLRHGSRASKELETFFGVPLWVETFDAD